MLKLLLAVLLTQGSASTLRDVIFEKRFGADPQLTPDVLSKRVDTYLIDGDATNEVVIAFSEPLIGTLPPKWHIVRWDLASGKWQHADISEATSPANAFTQIRRTQRYIYLDTHINPSAGRLVVLSHDLKLLGALDGWSLVLLPDESVVYHRNQVHFAPTHSLAISVFDPATQKDPQIYPPKPYQDVRSNFIERVEKAYKQRGEDWFRINNHHMNVELFDSALWSSITVDASAKTMAFSVRFGDPQNGRDPLDFIQDVVVTCSMEELQCRERAAP